ncbi:MAG: FG-GAP-like repeat-containing protein [Gammaproteobacteria bacterium]
MTKKNQIKFILFALLCFIFNSVFASPFNLTGQINISRASDGGVAWADMNNDLCLDAVVNEERSGGTANSYLFLQNSSGSGNCTGTFNQSFVFELTNSSILNRSVVLGDYDNDGDVDVAINRHNQIRHWRNNGSATFTLAGTFNHNSPASINAEGMSWVDYDADNDLDLVIENHEYGTRIYTNSGGNLNGSFIDIHSAGAVSGDYMASADYDVDGDVDLYFRRQGTANNDAQADLFRNNGGSFTRQSSANETASNGDKGGAVFCDLDSDGDFDLVRTNGGPVAAYRQNAGNFTSAATFSGSYDGVACADVDNDGDMDVLFTTRNNGNDALFINNGGFSFTQNNQGITAGGNGEGASFADYDRDGDMDVLINQNSNANQLYQNSQNDNNYLVVRATQSNRDSLGATARLFNCSGTPISGVRDINGGMGHGSQGAPFAHFGLANIGGSDNVYVVRVQYVGGAVVQRAVVPSAISGYQLETIDRSNASDTSQCNADLSITKDDGLLVYTPGGTATYTIVVTNNGPRNVVGARVEDALPDGVTVNGNWTCAAENPPNTASCVTGALAGTGATGTGNINQLVDIPANTFITFSVPVQFSADMADY